MDIHGLIGPNESLSFISITDAIEFRRALASGVVPSLLPPSLHRIGALYAGVTHVAKHGTMLDEPASQLLNLFVNAQAASARDQPFSTELTERTRQFVNHIAVAAAQQGVPPVDDSDRRHVMRRAIQPVARAIGLDSQQLIEGTKESAFDMLDSTSDLFAAFIRPGPLGDEQLMYTGAPPAAVHQRVNDELAHASAVPTGPIDDNMRSMAAQIATETGVSLIEQESPTYLIMLGGPSFVNELGRITSARRTDCARGLAMAMDSVGALPEPATNAQVQAYVLQHSDLAIDSTIASSVDQSQVGYVLRSFSGPVANDKTPASVLAVAQRQASRAVKAHHVTIDKLNAQFLASKYDIADGGQAEFIDAVYGLRETVNELRYSPFVSSYLDAVESGDTGRIDKQVERLARRARHEKLFEKLRLDDISEEQLAVVARAALPIAALRHLERRTESWEKTRSGDNAYISTRRRLGRLAEVGFDDLLLTRDAVELQGRPFTHAGAEFSMKVPAAYRGVRGQERELVAIACQLVRDHNVELMRHHTALQHPPLEPRTWRHVLRLKEQRRVVPPTPPTLAAAVADGLKSFAERHQLGRTESSQLASLVMRMAVDVRNNNVNWAGGARPDEERLAAINAETMRSVLGVEEREATRQQIDDSRQGATSASPTQTRADLGSIGSEAIRRQADQPSAEHHRPPGGRDVDPDPRQPNTSRPDRRVGQDGETDKTSRPPGRRRPLSLGGDDTRHPLEPTGGPSLLGKNSEDSVEDPYPTVADELGGLPLEDRHPDQTNNGPESPDQGNAL